MKKYLYLLLILCLLDGHGLGAIVTGFVNPHDGIWIGAGTVGAK